MKKTFLATPAVVLSCCLSLFLVSCNKEGETSSGDGGSASEGSAATGTENGKKRYKVKDVMAISREVSDYKKEIGYEMPAEARRLNEKLSEDVSRMADLRNNHPVLKRIDEEGAEAQAKLMQAVADKDEAAKEKWGPIAGKISLKKMEAVKSIPEIVELEKKIEADAAEIARLENEELSKTPKGKELVERSKIILEGFQNGSSN